MFSTDSRTDRILAPAGVQFIEALEDEIGRPIIIASGGRSWGDARRYAESAQQKFPEAENPVIVVIQGTLSYTPQSTWWYMAQWPRDCGAVANPDAGVSMYYPRSEFMAHRDESLLETIGFSISIDRDSNNGRPVVFAEAIENVVSIGFDLSRYDSGYDEVWANLDWEVLLGEPIRAAASDDIEATLAEFAKRRIERAFDAYVTTGRDRTLNQVRQRISQETQNITAFQERLTGSMRELASLNKQIQALEATLDEGTDTWLRRFQELCDHPKLTSVDFIGEQFVLTTDHLRMTHPNTGDSRWLGRFKIHVPIGTMNGYSIRFENLDNPKGERPHPHIEPADYGGGPCYGAVSSTVAQLHADFEIVALVDLLLMFLESFNPRDDWGSYAAYWFDVEDEDPRPEFNPNAVTEEPVPA